MDEALKLADHVAIMSEGKIIQYDTPENILEQPADDFVKELIGEDRLMQAQPDNTLVKDVMTAAVTITSEKSLQEAITLMLKKEWILYW
ncbi:ATP-binding component of an ABC superfamily L-carnitine/choline transporter [Tetragenococcus muriaticus 3MR10-3]|uniref:ATP-binding component of an ABC superfamily L-carnitine/choline transporter n=2 Tax=Tetragenococcus muriaticus TaxID=64642 RepID=A0A091C9J6_9ENTE|nr:ATP-binding component of an ABC superfamily L-carnitine/choline transporter [Tetragenococcus muriaticus 3MR10-3]